ncbi:UNVERIFIED_CONTAM: hypothetical protein K2H54_073246 [Gekko kuhli]
MAGNAPGAVWKRSRSRCRAGTARRWSAALLLAWRAGGLCPAVLQRPLPRAVQQALRAPPHLFSQGPAAAVHQRVCKRLAEVERPLRTITPQDLLGQRLAFLLDLLGACRAAQGEVEGPTAELEGVGRFTPEDKKEKMEVLKAALPTSGLGISKAKRVQTYSHITANCRWALAQMPEGTHYEQ